jgi:hypothetical protein
MAEWRDGGNGGRMAEWSNGRNGYLPTIFMVHADNDTNTFKSFIIDKPIGPAALWHMDRQTVSSILLLLCL